MAKRTPFQNVFWVANSIEILERFAYYGIYMGFGIFYQMVNIGGSFGYRHFRERSVDAHNHRIIDIGRGLGLVSYGLDK
jgi:hypothetical protein